MARIAVFVGTRPEIIKMAAILRELKRQSSIEIRVVHTGQHYDWEMSGQFFGELEMAEPDEFLGVGSDSQGAQLARIVQSAESYLLKKRIDTVAVEGDTNSALGVAIAASKNNTCLAHVEAGCRSFLKTMPEEMNRVLISDCADLNLAPTGNCVRNLRNEGIPDGRIKLTGHPIVTLIAQLKEKIEETAVLRRLYLKRRNYVLLTTHRTENVDHRSNLKAILQAARKLPATVVFPIHPRTQKNIARFHLKTYLSGMKTSPPLPYLETLRLIRDAEAVITDSGGIQQEATLLRTPCLTIRETTEWVETVLAGVNTIVKDTDKLGEAFVSMRLGIPQIQARFRRARLIFGTVESARNCTKVLVESTRST